MILFSRWSTVPWVGQAGFYACLATRLCKVVQTRRRFYDKKCESFVRSRAAAALDVSLQWTSSTEVVKALKQSDVPAARCLFKMIHSCIFSCKWEHCSHLLVNFKAFLVVRGELHFCINFPSFGLSVWAALFELSVIINGWLISWSTYSVSVGSENSPFCCQWDFFYYCVWVDLFFVIITCLIVGV